ncbi:hypothetical protein N8K70_06370 [Microbacterium betulae]|uniref:DUF624 domain-containing protein n=1 Tax=Microbacterium betulae TaxID=2981139 RepID=A0AA97FIQ1_9MICO|nr:hypothetical protein [Microbacterium sp. AB]WOF24291.1 hypothetical protein N8K70_06370 [Microbacterium sp. AB]
MGRSERTARRAAASGSGPTHDAPGRNPGASGGFALFGEVLLTGVLVTAAGLPVVTLPAALAAGSRHLRRFARAEGSSLRAFGADLRAALPGGLPVGAVAAAIVAVLALDVVLAVSGALPGGGIVGAIGWALLAALGGAVLAVSGAWTPETGWRPAVRALPASVARDVPGALYLVAAACFVGLAAWMLVPLVVPALGCAALASVAVPERPRRSG